MYTPVNLIFVLIKVGYDGYSLHGYVYVMKTAVFSSLRIMIRINLRHR